MSAKKLPSKRTKRGGVSGNTPRVDARVKRTRDALGDALIELMQLKSFDDIKVQDVLERAGVSRSAFYAHFRDKEDLFVSDADDFFEYIAQALPKRRDPSDRVAPVGELFTHLREMQKHYEALIAAGRVHDTMELARGHFARGIEARLSQIERARGLPEAQRAAVAQAQAGALIALLQWWIARGMQAPPREMDELFHRLFWSGVE